MLDVATAMTSSSYEPPHPSPFREAWRTQAHPLAPKTGAASLWAVRLVGSAPTFPSLLFFFFDERG